jgi:opacity protein-like surface antigen
VGAEAAFAGPDWDFSTGSAVGVASIDPSYHFLIKSHPRIEPFATGGYSLYFGERTDFQSGFNLGGGVNFWVAKHVALRPEVRYQEGIHYFHSQFTRFVAFRFGLTFR